MWRVALTAEGERFEHGVAVWRKDHHRPIAVGLRWEEFVNRVGRDVNAPEHHFSHRLDRGAQLDCLGIAAGERLFGILETEMPAVEHRRIHVSKYLAEIVLAQYV